MLEIQLPTSVVSILSVTSVSKVSWTTNISEK